MGSGGRSRNASCDGLRSTIQLQHGRPVSICETSSKSSPGSGERFGVPFRDRLWSRIPLLRLPLVVICVTHSGSTPRYRIGYVYHPRNGSSRPFRKPALLRMLPSASVSRFCNGTSRPFVLRMDQLAVVFRSAARRSKLVTE